MWRCKRNWRHSIIDSGRNGIYFNGWVLLQCDCKSRIQVSALRSYVNYSSCSYLFIKVVWLSVCRQRKTSAATTAHLLVVFQVFQQKYYLESPDSKGIVSWGCKVRGCISTTWSSLRQNCRRQRGIGLSSRTQPKELPRLAPQSQWYAVCASSRHSVQVQIPCSDESSLVVIYLLYAVINLYHLFQVPQ
jgi:hypothetical protein